jgi:mannose-6-phosphate isomerase-like protein (cupin superfamily)
MDRINRPWGWYENLYDNSTYKIKRLGVNPNEQISLQYHKLRNEHWVVVEGDGKIIIGEDVKNVSIGDYIFVPMGCNHRISSGDCGIIIVEVQQGSLCDENDIVRIHDDYGRV